MSQAGSQAVLPIGEVARRSGVAESTLRAWERRYGLLEPERTAGGHRRYRLDDVALIRTVAELVGSGWGVEAAAREAIARRDASAASTGARPTPAADSHAPSPQRRPAPASGTGATAGADQPTRAQGSIDVLSAREAAADGTARAAGVPRDPGASDGSVDGPALAAAYRATLRLLRLDDPAGARDILAELVVALGGRVVSAADAGEDAIPVDLSFGSGEVTLPAAAPMSLARMRLEFLLPELVEAARRIVDLLRAAQRVR